MKRTRERNGREEFREGTERGNEEEYDIFLITHSEFTDAWTDMRREEGEGGEEGREGTEKRREEEEGEGREGKEGGNSSEETREGGTGEREMEKRSIISEGRS